MLRGAAVAVAPLLLAAGIGAAEFTAYPVHPKGESGREGFQQRSSSQTGIEFRHSLPVEQAIKNVNLANGSGLALGDFDSDGLVDIYFCNLGGGNRLYRNLGSWRFDDITASAGVALESHTSTGALFEDINGDGRPDLIVTALEHPPVCFVNRGDGRFADMTSESGLAGSFGGTTMAMADIDQDSDLDLYVCNFGSTSILRGGGAISVVQRGDKWVVRGKDGLRVRAVDGVLFELGEPDDFYLNDGHGQFTKVSWTDGRFRWADGSIPSEPIRDQGLSAMFRDVNGDGAPDLYVCNDGATPDRFWINQGNGTFIAAGPHWLAKLSYFSMGIDFSDVNRDGLDDFVVAEMLSRDHKLVITQKPDMHQAPPFFGEPSLPPQFRRSMMYLQRAGGGFAEIGFLSGLAAMDWSWTPIFMDVDLDGWEDLLVTNGFMWDVDQADISERIRAMGPMSLAESRRSVLLYPELRTPNVAFRNLKNLRFEETGADWGFDSTEISHGMASGDLDGDGDLDLVVNCLNAEPLLYENIGTAPRIAVRLKGRGGNPSGVGARITVTGGLVDQTQEVIAGGRYMSDDDGMRVFAAAGAEEFQISVKWRSGAATLIEGVKPNHVYEIEEPGELGPYPLTEKAKGGGAPLFEDHTARLDHWRDDPPFNDFTHQPLAPRGLACSGPSLGWVDLDNDGVEELVIAPARGGVAAVYHVNADGDFEPLNVTGHAVRGDAVALSRWQGSEGEARLLISESAYEQQNGPGAVIELARTGDGSLKQSALLENLTEPPGAIAAADYDGDGDLDLFVGGGVRRGEYPYAGRPVFVKNDQGSLTIDSANTKRVQFEEAINGAVFSDLTGDGFPELIVACELGPIRVLENRNGAFHEVTRQLGLDGFAGWWNGVSTGDFDNDGRMDIIASNWGLNTHYARTEGEPLLALAHDMESDGVVEFFEGYFNAREGKNVPWRDRKVMAAGAPLVASRFPTHGGYAGASLETILGDAFDQARRVKVNTFATMVFLNRGTHFDEAPLPVEAQMAPSFGIAVADFSGDGTMDLFLAQNFSWPRPEDEPLNSGRGLLLIGNGHGNFQPVSSVESGIDIPGDQRGCAVGDWDGDGRMDLVIGQNRGLTRVYRNARGQPGLRVKLAGPPENLAGIGAVIRPRYDDGRAVAAVEAQSTSGSGGVHSRWLIAPRDGKDRVDILVRWPSGEERSYEISGDAHEVELRIDGAWKALR